jgi:hypothetical protein
MSSITTSTVAKHLVVLGCSATKIQTNGALPAITLYDGPTFRVLRAFLRDYRWPPSLSVAVFSAKYGMIGGLSHISPYDQRMNRHGNPTGSTCTVTIGPQGALWIFVSILFSSTLPFRRPEPLASSRWLHKPLMQPYRRTTSLFWGCSGPTLRCLSKISPNFSRTFSRVQAGLFSVPTAISR